MARAVRLQAGYLAVEDCRFTADVVRDLFAEIRPGLVHVPAARDGLTAVAVDVRERSEAVVLRLEQSIRIVERFAD